MNATSERTGRAGKIKSTVTAEAQAFCKLDDHRIHYWLKMTDFSLKFGFQSGVRRSEVHLFMLREG